MRLNTYSILWPAMYSTPLKLAAIWHVYIRYSRSTYLFVPGLSVERNLSGILSRSHSLLIAIVLTLPSMKYIYSFYMDVESRNPDADANLAVVRYCIAVSLRSTSRCIHFSLVAVCRYCECKRNSRNRKQMIRWSVTQQSARWTKLPVRFTRVTLGAEFLYLPRQLGVIFSVPALGML